LQGRKAKKALPRHNLRYGFKHVGQQLPTAGFQPVGDEAPAPAAVPGAMDEDERRERGERSCGALYSNTPIITGNLPLTMAL
jgi:hypothetical protein